MTPDLIVLDTETTGLTQPIGVVELAYARINDQLEALDEYDSLVNPGREIEPGATEVHGIKDKDVQGAISLKQALAPIAGRPCVLIGHNINFDYKLVADELQVVGMVCTLALSRQYIHDSENHKLGTLQKHLGLPDFEAHRALGDVFTALNLLRSILHKYRLPLQTVIKRQELPRMLHTMPYGKFKGRSLMDVPADYRRWLLHAGNLDQDLLYSLKKLEHL